MSKKQRGKIWSRQSALLLNNRRLKLVLLLGRPGAFSSLGRWRRPTGVQLADDGLHLALQVLLALLQLVDGGVLVGVEPGDSGVDGGFNGGFVVVREFAAQLLLVADLENIFFLFFF